MTLHASDPPACAALRQRFERFLYANRAMVAMQRLGYFPPELLHRAARHTAVSSQRISSFLLRYPSPRRSQRAESTGHLNVSDACWPQGQLSALHWRSVDAKQQSGTWLTAVVIFDAGPDGTQHRFASFLGGKCCQGGNSRSNAFSSNSAPVRIPPRNKPQSPYGGIHSDFLGLRSIALKRDGRGPRSGKLAPRLDAEHVDGFAQARALLPCGARGAHLSPCNPSTDGSSSRRDLIPIRSHLHRVISHGTAAQQRDCSENSDFHSSNSVCSSSYRPSVTDLEFPRPSRAVTRSVSHRRCPSYGDYGLSQGRRLPQIRAQRLRSKLTSEQVHRIRYSGESAVALTKELGISFAAVRHIRQRKYWRDVP